jgi:hypothetical protein
MRFTRNKFIVFISDGAAWLAKCRQEHFPNASQILDWYHAVEHLWETSRKLSGENNEQRLS